MYVLCEHNVAAAAAVIANHTRSAITKSAKKKRISTFESILPNLQNTIIGVLSENDYRTIQQTPRTHIQRNFPHKLTPPRPSP